MDYKKMWYMMKENLLRESQRRELGTIRMDAVEQHLKIMDDIEVKVRSRGQVRRYGKAVHNRTRGRGRRKEW